mmetsp:Transcript_110630/g.253364  ORF Transcript_110630/g.253364 Transcript_110630/m.253364 type:complete len:724 (-) Transcript_110630:23-2194(-)
MPVAVDSWTPAAASGNGAHTPEKDKIRGRSWVGASPLTAAEDDEDELSSDDGGDPARPLSMPSRLPAFLNLALPGAEDFLFPSPRLSDSESSSRPVADSDVILWVCASSASAPMSDDLFPAACADGSLLCRFLRASFPWVRLPNENGQFPDNPFIFCRACVDLGLLASEVVDPMDLLEATDGRGLLDTLRVLKLQVQSPASSCDTGQKQDGSEWRELLKHHRIKPLRPAEKGQLQELVASGIPDDLRAQVWMLLSGAQQLLQARPRYYTELVRDHEADVGVAHQIQLDASRTLLTKKTSTRPLCRVLTAFAKHNRHIGYCQGMNYLAAFLLDQLDEQCSFFVLCELVERLLPEGYFSDSMMGVVVDQHILATLIAERHTDVARRLNSIYVDTSLFALQWFLCIFVGFLPGTLVLRIWDHFLTLGSTVLFAAAVSLVASVEDELVTCNGVADVVQVFAAAAQPDSVSVRHVEEFLLHGTWPIVKMHALEQLREGLQGRQRCAENLAVGGSVGARSIYNPPPQSFVLVDERRGRVASAYLRQGTTTLGSHRKLKKRRFRTEHIREQDFPPPQEVAIARPEAVEDNTVTMVDPHYDIVENWFTPVGISEDAGEPAPEEAEPSAARRRSRNPIKPLLSGIKHAFDHLGKDSRNRLDVTVDSGVHTDWESAVHDSSTAHFDGVSYVSTVGASKMNGASLKPRKEASKRRKNSKLQDVELSVAGPEAFS